ncbi:MAG: hypothetical protein WBF53_08095, partial [Litorimonas sp.]
MPVQLDPALLDRLLPELHSAVAAAVRIQYATASSSQRGSAASRQTPSPTSAPRTTTDRSR